MAGVLGATSATYEYSAGWVLDVPTGRWIEVPGVDGRQTYPGTNTTAVGRAACSCSAGRTGRRRGCLGDAWLWTPPAAAGADRTRAVGCGADRTEKPEPSDAADGGA